MKKKLLALVLVLAMLLSCTLMLTSCPDDDPPAVDPELNLDEGVEGNGGSSLPNVITDPTNPEASGNEDKYIHDR